MPFRAACLFYFDLKHRVGGGTGRQEPIFIGAGNYKGVFLPTGAYVRAPSLKGLNPSLYLTADGRGSLPSTVATSF